ncbi:MAG: hypothetical protein GX162_03755 [Firmicutes bacterium]|jgi:hypothetical protein|nr:hypothetical protein [Bacillota bacterium]
MKAVVKIVTINAKDTGYRGIWYMNQPTHDEYVFKYSGGLGTYPANHQPFAVYCQEVNKTFFCYGGTTKNSCTELVHMVSYYDHSTGLVPRPTLLLNKNTNDAHDNPVISVDGRGHIWIFSTAHGTSRPSYIHRSVRPYDIDEFERIDAVRLDGGQAVPMDNFSYMQVWPTGDTRFLCFFTKYHYPAKRTLCFMTSDDGIHWSEWQRLAAIDEGHYQTSALGRKKAGSAFNYHPNGLGLNHRTNLYYIETIDEGKTWQAADGTPLDLPLTDPKNPALVRDYETEGSKVYINDVTYDEHDRPVILYVTSKGYEPGPQNDPRVWTIAHWLGDRWEFKTVTTSDNNYDMGSIYIEADGTWRIIGPTETGPQPYNPGGEVALWVSKDQGHTWEKARQMTFASARNHTYVRRPLNAHPEFYAFWADGHARQVSESYLYFSDAQGNVRMLPPEMDEDFMVPRYVSGEPRPSA